jgi:hypothetical protein
MFSVGVRALSDLHDLGDLLRVHEQHFILATLVKLDRVGFWCRHHLHLFLILIR